MKTRKIIIKTIIVMMMMMTTALKGVIQDFWTISSLRYKLCPKYMLTWQRHHRVQTTCNTISSMLYSQSGTLKHQNAVCQEV